MFFCKANTFDNTTATLIYYRNFVSGEPSDGAALYTRWTDSEALGLECSVHPGCTWQGPITAVTHLPTTSTWNNITLKTDTRAILAEDGTTHNATSISRGTLPTAFSYSGHAARLLTAQELMSGCGLTQITVSGITRGELSNCNFLLERTKYADSNKETEGVWLENFRS